MSEIVRSTWQNINYDPFHAALTVWLSTHPDEASLDKVHLHGLARQTGITSQPQFQVSVQELEALLETTYDAFAVPKNHLSSYQKYGLGRRAVNYGGDDIMSMLNGVKTFFPNRVWQRIATTIGDGYPRLWRWFAPNSQVTAFDINPMQHANWSQQLGSDTGANSGALVDAGVAEWFTSFLRLAEPEILYMSNIVHFLCLDQGQVEAVAESLLAVQPEVVVCTYPGDTTSETRFLDQLMQQYRLLPISSRVRHGVRDNWLLIRQGTSSTVDLERAK